MVESNFIEENSFETSNVYPKDQQQFKLKKNQQNQILFYFRE